MSLLFQLFTNTYQLGTICKRCDFFLWSLVFGLWSLVFGLYKYTPFPSDIQ
jgi:hypothetical protein